MRLEDKRAAAKALTPYRDRIADKIKWFFVKAAFVGLAILILCLVSYNSWKGN